MPVRYQQFCALARAAEILGERWTLLIVRELMLGPRRFTDLKDGLDGISASVLSERMAHLDELGLVTRTFLEPPAASTVYELTEAGKGLKPAIFALVRWGGRFLFPPRPGDRIDPRWMSLALAACARREPTPSGSIALRIEEPVQGDAALSGRAAAVRVEGGARGTTVSTATGEADVRVRIDTVNLLRLIGGDLDPMEAVQDGIATVEGKQAVYERMPQLFEVGEYT
jgi:DNA-binding HxlR family transcriptional regulator